jgi:hypothetical protein
MTLTDFAEIHVFEAHINLEGVMEWRPIADLSFDREYLGVKQVNLRAPMSPVECVEQVGTPEPEQASMNGGANQSAAAKGEVVVRSRVDANLARTAVAHALGIPIDSPALIPGAGVNQAGEAVTGTGGGMQQINVDYGAEGHHPKHHTELNFLRFGGGQHREKKRGQIRDSIVRLGAELVASPADVAQPPAAGAPRSFQDEQGGMSQSAPVDKAEGSLIRIINRPIVQGLRLNSPNQTPSALDESPEAAAVDDEGQEGGESE